MCKLIPPGTKALYIFENTFLLSITCSNVSQLNIISYFSFSVKLCTERSSKDTLDNISVAKASDASFLFCVYKFECSLMSLLLFIFFPVVYKVKYSGISIPLADLAPNSAAA